jgi:hypothetical protein
MLPPKQPIPLAAHGLRELKGDDSWPFRVFVDGLDLVLFGVRATCFGGVADPQDDGQTASGHSTKDPEAFACSLPMDGRMFPHMSRLVHAALDGSPIPRVPWETMVHVRAKNGTQFIVPVWDLGPGHRTGNALDLTIKAARKINPQATATNFEAIVDVRILGAAKYAPKE